MERENQNNSRNLEDDNSLERDRLLENQAQQQILPPMPQQNMNPVANQAMNPYGRGQPIPNYQLPIRPAKYKCARRDKWVQQQGNGYLEILQDQAPSTCCIGPAYSYKIFAHQSEIGKFWEKSEDLMRCFCAARARTMESHLEIQGQHYVGKKPLKLGYIPCAFCCITFDDQLPQVSIFKDGVQIAFVISSFWPNCSGGTPHWECYRGSKRDPSQLMFVITNYDCQLNCSVCCQRYCICLTCRGCRLENCPCLNINCDQGCEGCCFNCYWHTGKMNVWGRDYTTCNNRARPIDELQIWKEYNGWRCCKQVPSKWQVKIPEGDLDVQATFIIAVHALDMLFKVK